MRLVRLASRKVQLLATTTRKKKTSTTCFKQRLLNPALQVYPRRSEEDEPVKEGELVGAGGVDLVFDAAPALRRPRTEGEKALARRERRSSFGVRAIDALANVRAGIKRLYGALGGLSRASKRRTGHKGVDTHATNSIDRKLQCSFQR